MCIKWLIEFFEKRNQPKPPPPEEKKWASVEMNADFLNVQTRSGYRMTVSDSSGDDIFLNPDADDISIGDAVVKALSKSRMIDPKDFGVFFDPDRLQNQYNDWIDYCKKTYRYKTKKALYKNMMSVAITAYEGKLILRSRHQEKPGGYGPSKNKDKDNVIIPEDSTPEEIGKAIRLALSRCTSAV
ncbi:MAG: Immunity protein CdiI-o11 [Holosporales bacterium]